MILEICVDSLAAAKDAVAGGADRIELCSRLDLDGLTPDPELLNDVLEQIELPIMVMIRPRAGDFCVNETDFELMKEQLQKARAQGAHGLVFGLLKSSTQTDGVRQIDTARCAELLELAGALPCTFHRAFDLLPDSIQATAAIQSLGFRRILSSGGAASVCEGLATLRKMVAQAGDGLSILPGGGVRPHNAAQILHATGADELHSSMTRGWQKL